MQETTKMPRNYYHLHTWQTSDKTTLSTIVHALTNQPYQETTTLQSAVIGTFQPMALFGYICCQSNPAIQTPLWLELVQG